MCFFFKQKTAYEMRISDWSSDVCSSDLEREILFPRLLLGLGVWRAGTVPLRDLLLVQMDWAWRAEPHRTALLVRAAGAEDALRTMLRKSRPEDLETLDRDRKSTRLNSSH